jgi:hypothetical protein
LSYPLLIRLNLQIRFLNNASPLLPFLVQ